MYQNLISHNQDLKGLRDEGYEIEIKENHLLIHSVPYLDSNKTIKYGTLVTELSISGDKIDKPKNHVINFTGEYPCNIDGSAITQLKHNSSTRKLSENITVNHSFSNRPKQGLNDYYEKVTHYLRIICAPAEHIDNSVTAKTYRIIESHNDESVFNYLDTNSSRAEIIQISNKLRNQKIGIIGVGGTGSYILDFIVKTPVSQIHIFDGDKFIQHNAFRAPGAALKEVLNVMPMKVDYLKSIYENMHKHIFAHAYYINESNVTELEGLDFVFISVDKGEIKKQIITKLEIHRIPFIDVGMGIEVVNESLIGTLRVTTNDMKDKCSILERNRISLSDNNDDDYKQNIQIAELNALNASVAVIKWKKLLGFYMDSEQELHSTYTINENQLLSEDIRV
jgi:molybdopterin/thiamine biosynthesis adenylyltransferase